MDLARNWNLGSLACKFSSTRKLLAHISGKLKFYPCENNVENFGDNLRRFLTFLALFKHVDKFSSNRGLGCCFPLGIAGSFYIPYGPFG